MRRAALRLRLLSDLGDIAAEDGRLRKQVFLRTVIACLTCALARGNRRMYATCFFAEKRVLGCNYAPDRLVPVSDAAPEQVKGCLYRSLGVVMCGPCFCCSRYLAGSSAPYPL